MNSLKISVFKTLFLALLTLSLASCKKEVFVAEGYSLADWSSATHSNKAEPNYAVVFNQDKVNRIDFVLTTEEYDAMQEDLADLLSSSSGQQGASLSRTANYFAVDMFFNGRQWYDVGLRYKGNSSLKSAGSQGNNKLPLRIKMDYFEDENPEILNQRFYGFKDLSLSSGFNDQSLMREKVAADLFREFGVPAAQTAFYEIWIDEGDGTPKYYGLYTLVEVVFDTMLDKMFSSDNGNCYKPDGDGATFSTSGFDLADFEKKTNETEADWSDIQELYDVLHSSDRSSNTEQWKSNMESVFDVDGFMKYLAVNNTIQNWDTYGNMTHNYYLYHDPADDLIKWIPWDNNEAFNSGRGPRAAISFEMSEVGNDWPLIPYLSDIAEYRAIYDQYIEDFINGPFLPSKMDSEYAAWDAMISASAASEVSGYSFLNGISSYNSAVSTLKTHASQRVAAAQNYLD